VKKKGNTKPRMAEIRDFILDNVADYPTSITSEVTKRFDISRQWAHKQAMILVKEGRLSQEGNTRNRTYTLRAFKEELFSEEISTRLQEDVVWRNRILPDLSDIPENVRHICSYGFTEILNNARDHSDGTRATIRLARFGNRIELMVSDNGVGIFKKIQKVLNLEDPRQSILELSKGKFTTDPQNHSGEGIFFSSRAFDEFNILSGDLFFTHVSTKDDWLIETRALSEGTTVFMRINEKSDRTLKSVMDKYSAESDEFGFSKTIVPVALTQYNQENLLSRSQAKRLLSRFDRFREVVLDFKGVDFVGQAFADEIFRVFRLSHPSTQVIPINMNEEIEKMVSRARFNLPSEANPTHRDSLTPPPTELEQNV
jgi:anti-sigma regulatory factor (Ser/Thr protein kinase)/anti-anti-sigma regulatory factor/Fe-S cluster biosynthesis and repair protein YggX